MRANRRRDTSQEMALRSALHRRGWRFGVDRPIRLTGGTYRPDISFARLKLVVYCDGCFWHSCPIHGTRPKANSEYWDEKLAENVRRDRRTTAALTAAGWKVIRIWEHEPLANAVAVVEEALSEQAATVAYAGDP
jgi:DNA mismatch endonuclease, patch repair protein